MSARELEAVDFYSGHKRTLEYLGTIWTPDGSPEGLDALECFTALSLENSDERYVESDFLKAVEELRRQYDSTKKWPHAGRNSLGTEWTYRFDLGSVTVYYQGVLYVTYLCNGAREPYQFFPDMRAGAAAG